MFFPQQRKLRGSSAQHSSGVHWCMQAPGQVQRGSGEGSGEGLGNRVLEKVPEKFWESQVRFNRVPENVPEKVWEALVEPGLVQVNKVPEKVLEKVPEKAPGGFGAEPGQVQQGSRKTWYKAKSSSTGSGEGSEGLGGFGAEPGQIQ